MQPDIKAVNGFQDFYHLFSGEDSQSHGIHTFEFTEDDIKRSEILKFIVKKINKGLTNKNKNK
jgi:hypothetical protein